MDLPASRRLAVLPRLLPHFGVPNPQFRISRLPCSQIIVQPHGPDGCARRSTEWFFETSFVEYEIGPREKTATQLGGTWDYKNDVTLSGTITPDPAGGTVHVRLDFQNQQARWVTVAAAPGREI